MTRINPDSFRRRCAQSANDEIHRIADSKLLLATRTRHLERVLQDVRNIAGSLDARSNLRDADNALLSILVMCNRALEEKEVL